jgi:hypothetical protein
MIELKGKQGLKHESLIHFHRASLHTAFPFGKPQALTTKLTGALLFSFSTCISAMLFSFSTVMFDRRVRSRRPEHPVSVYFAELAGNGWI